MTYLKGNVNYKNPKGRPKNLHLAHRFGYYSGKVFTIL